jgi:ABC-type lipoprotein export system ATPase subunit
MAGAGIEVVGVSRRFKLGSEDVWAVRDVSVTIAPNEFVAFVGRSGSGKTTLLNLIAGLDRPTEGAVSIDGERVDTMNDRALDQLRRKKLGFIFQSFGLLPLLSAKENVELPLRISNYRAGDRAKRVKRVLDMVGLGKRAEHRPYELSGGEQQRVAIARALASEPTLILADEPTGELDSSTATAIFTLLRDLARAEGITIVTCTHDRLVMEMAGRIEELADGHLVTGQNREVWRHVQQRERSPFAALPPAEGLGGDEAPAQPLSSLIGADMRSFATGSLREEPTVAPADPIAEKEPESPDEAARWARPDR